MIGKKLIEEKIGKAIGLEKAMQKAVEELRSNGLLKTEYKKKLNSMKNEADQQQREMEVIIEEIAENEGRI
ncbi:MAG TPA: hypothetical protein VJ697_12920 [Nitrososphaeraceae archaeon]|nr:hypothetical protein [Nitrososphaeraceae archaeon]